LFSYLTHLRYLILLSDSYLVLLSHSLSFSYLNHLHSLVSTALIFSGLSLILILLSHSASLSRLFHSAVSLFLSFSCIILPHLCSYSFSLFFFFSHSVASLTFILFSLSRNLLSNSFSCSTYSHSLSSLAVIL
jgi:hypothetical protein